MARPSKYSEAVAERICTQLAAGLSLRKICEADDLPSDETVRRWLRDMPEFRAQYAEARKEQAEHYAQEIVEIADTEADAAKARVRIDARKWVACKLLPKVYGEKIDHNHAGQVSYTIVTGVDGGLDGGGND